MYFVPRTTRSWKGASAELTQRQSTMPVIRPMETISGPGAISGPRGEGIGDRFGGDALPPPTTCTGFDR